MSRPKYMQAARLNADGTVSDVAHLVMTSFRCHDYDHDGLVITLHLISFVQQMKDQEFVTLAPFPPTPIVFDLKLVHAGYEEARFATKQDILLPSNLQGRGIGSYIMSELIDWGVSLKPYYRVVPLRLGSADAMTDEARERRNGFYKSLNFDFDFRCDPEERTGYCCAETLAQLNPRKNTDKIKVLDLCDVLRTCQADNAANIDRVKHLRESMDWNNAFWRRKVAFHRWVGKVLGVALVIVLAFVYLTYY